jgi:hypothetical protein
MPEQRESSLYPMSFGVFSVHNKNGNQGGGGYSSNSMSGKISKYPSSKPVQDYNSSSAQTETILTTQLNDQAYSSKNSQ